VQDNTDVGDEGAKAIASALKENKTVKELHLVKFVFVLYFLQVFALVLHWFVVVLCDG
jgi:hypothetical protein